MKYTVAAVLAAATGAVAAPLQGRASTGPGGGTTHFNTTSPPSDVFTGPPGFGGFNTTSPATLVATNRTTPILVSNGTELAANGSVLACTGGTPPQSAAAGGSSSIAPTQMDDHDVFRGNDAPAAQFNLIRAANQERSLLVQFDIPDSAVGSTCTVVIDFDSTVDLVQDGAEVDVFSTNFASLDGVTSGNLRNNQLGRLQAVVAQDEFIPDPNITDDLSFDCPSGSLVLEFVAVGEVDSIDIAQALTADADGVINGVSLEVSS